MSVIETERELEGEKDRERWKEKYKLMGRQKVEWFKSTDRQRENQNKEVKSGLVGSKW